MPELAKYGVQTTFFFPLVTADSDDFLTGAAHAAGDSKIIKDGGAAANTTNGFVEEGVGWYSLTLTAAEMQAKRICISIIDQGSKAFIDQGILIQTHGHASASLVFDLDQATPDVNVAAMDDDVLTLDAAAGSFIAGVQSGLATSVEVDAVPTAAENAAALLKYDMSTVTGEAARSPLNALRFLRNKWSILTGTLTVTKEDDTATAWTAVLTQTAGAQPVTASDPA